MAEQGTRERERAAKALEVLAGTDSPYCKLSKFEVANLRFAARLLRTDAPEGQRWTLEEIDRALYDAHRRWDSRNMVSLSKLLEEELRRVHPLGAPGERTEQSDGGGR